MSEETFDRLPMSPSEPRVEAAGSMGLAEKLLAEKGDLKPYNTWMGITTSKKTYPDDMVLDFARWGVENSNRFMLVIADAMQVFNKMAIKGIDPFRMNEQQRRDFERDVRDYKRAARKRQGELRTLFKEAGLENVRVRLWSDLIKVLRGRDWRDEFVVDSFIQMAYIPGLDETFDSQMKNIVQAHAGHILGRSEGNHETAEFVASLYPREQLVLTLALSTLGVYKYVIKIGPEGERAYDQAALDIFRDGFGSFRGKLDPNTTFASGAVYLRQKGNHS